MRISPLALFVLVLATTAVADLDVGVRNGDKIRATIFPESEVETYRVDLPRGAVLSVSGKPKKTGDRRFPPDLRMRLLDPVGRDITGDHLRVRGKRTTLTGFEAPTTGRYAIEVRGDGFDVGDYLLSVTWRAPRKVKRKRIDLDGGATTDLVDVVADADSTLKIQVVASRKSAVLPRVVEVVRLPSGGESDETVVREYSVPSKLAKKHKVDATVRTTGEFRIRAADGIAGGGQVDVKVTVRPGVAKRSVRLTDAEVGTVPLGTSILSTVLLDAAGGVTAGDSARVEVPLGGLSRLTTVRVGLGPAFDGPPGTGLLPAGPGVFVGPEFLEFDRLADIVVPFDPDAFDGAPLSEMRVVRIDAAGLHTVLAAGAVIVDEATSTARVPIGRGGRYAAFHLVPPPAPTSLTPFAGDLVGGYPITLGGSGFRDLRDAVTGASLLAILLDGQPVAVQITAVTPTLLTFTAPPHAAGRVTFGVRDPETGLVGTLPPTTFLYR